jgi:hypothetical protein
MKDKTENLGQKRLIEEIEAKQSNTLWPDATNNSRSVDEFFWKGDPNAPLVQRMGAWIFGLTFILMGLGLFDIAYEKQDRLTGVISLIPFLLAAKSFSTAYVGTAAKHKAK